ncbi:MAG TPA: FlgD immunoglobulin-like domain containing protein [Bacteroidales bacterium]|nr:FlgD immunoglobulin-like domain containing protein [Bacteroidales bacterium]
MKKLLLLTIVSVFAIHGFAQTLIATSNHNFATAHHNQRKIVRDSDENIYVVFADWIDQHSVIKGVHYNRSLQQWGEPFFITDGTNPTLAISADDHIHLLMQTNSEPEAIVHLQSTDFINWLSADTISSPGEISYLPVADVDAAGTLNVLWRQQNNDYTRSVIYAAVVDGEPVVPQIVMTKTFIDDIAIANHLQYGDDNLFFAIHYNQDSLSFFLSEDSMNTFAIIYSALGSQPCISFNTWWIMETGSARFLYINPQQKLCEVEAFEDDSWQIQSPIVMPLQEVIENVCIDDLMPPIGYSFLTLGGGKLKHNFSYGSDWGNWMATMERIYGNNISNPSIAYKHFSFHYVDFIWTDNSSGNNDIFYMRDEKYVYIGIDDPDPDKGFSITGNPNPFADQIVINISVEKETDKPLIEIYNHIGQRVKTIVPEQNDVLHYYYCWNGTDDNGSKLAPGTYVIVCTVGNTRTARKVIFRP